LNHFLPDRGFIQKLVFGLKLWRLNTNARIAIQRIKIRQAIFGEQFINSEASLATKLVPSRFEAITRASCPAVKANMPDSALPCLGWRCRQVRQAVNIRDHFSALASSLKRPLIASHFLRFTN
jgi:hypothetical protein